jgi:hypothetical protein
MITESIISSIVWLFNAGFSWGEVVTELPFGGDTLATAFAMARTVGEYFPPLATLLTAFTIYVAFLIGLRLLALIPVVRNTVTHVTQHTR